MSVSDCWSISMFGSLIEELQKCPTTLVRPFLAPYLPICACCRECRPYIPCLVVVFSMQHTTLYSPPFSPYPSEIRDCSLLYFPVRLLPAFTWNLNKKQLGQEATERILLAVLTQTLQEMLQRMNQSSAALHLIIGTLLAGEEDLKIYGYTMGPYNFSL